jgi:uncharacterized protein YkwD
MNKSSKKIVLFPFLFIFLSPFLLYPSIAQENADCFDRENYRQRDELLSLINTERMDRGLAPLACDSEVSVVAQNHAEDMHRRGYFSHITPEGKDHAGRLDSAGVVYLFAGENLAWGQDTARAVIKKWMGSPPHRENILRGDWTHVGIGAYGKYWVMVFVKK